MKTTEKRRWKISRRSFLKGLATTGAAFTLLGRSRLAAADPSLAVAGAEAASEAELYGYTHCDMCNQMPKCGVKAIIKGNKVVRVDVRENYPNTPFCAKGVASLQELYDPERLLYPVKRTRPKGAADPGWQRISWDEAYDTIVTHLNEIKARYGAEKVLFYVGDPKEPRSAVQRLAYTFGSPNYGNESSTCFRAIDLASRITYGLTTTGSAPTKSTKVCLIWSRNAAWSMPCDHGKYIKAKAAGTKFIVVDPRVTPTVTALADIHLQLRPGTDGALALGMLNVIIEGGLYDKEFVASWVHGFEELREYVKRFPPEEAARITGVPADKIVAAAKLFATERPATWVGSASPTVHHYNGVQNTRAILALVAICGCLEVEGGVTWPTEPLPFDLFAGSPAFNRETDLFPLLRDKRVDRDHFPVWAHYLNEIQVNPLPEYVAEGKIRAMVMFGGNAMMWPQTPEYQKAIANMDFSVAVDYYLRPWTHNFMDIVLPAATTYERMAPLTIFGRRIFLREPVVPPLGEARSDWQIALELGTRLGYPQEFWNGSEEEALNELLRPLGLTVQDLRGKPEGVLVPAKGPEKYKKYELGLLRKDGKPGFPTPTGKVEIASTVLAQYGFDALPTYREPLESPLSTPDLAKRYPLILNTGSRVPMYTHSKLRELPWLNRLMPGPIVRLHPRDAAARGIKDYDKVVLSSPHGQITLRAQVTNMVMPGMVDVFHGWPQADCNLLIPRKFDPISGYPTYKAGLCEVRKVAE